MTGSVGLTHADGPSKLHGSGTEFLKFFKAGDSVMLATGGEAASVKAVLSDTELELSKPFDAETTKTLMESPAPFKQIPHMDQGNVYVDVTTRLFACETIGIFPEGGSHDRAEMLPLKAGAAIMALTAMAAHPELDIKIVPCGLNYFHPYAFRSRAVIEFGHPISVTPEKVEKFKQGGEKKHESISALLQEIFEGLGGVTVNAPDIETLQVIQAARRLYKPTNHFLTSSETIKLTRQFAKGYARFKDNPKVEALKVKVSLYNQLLKTYDMRDHEVCEREVGMLRAARLLLARHVLVFWWALLALPGVILNGPIAYLSVRISKRKAKEALEASTVKIAGNDVLATWKLMVALVVTPLLYFLYSLGAAFTSAWFQFPTSSPVLSFFLTYTSLPFIGYVSIRFGENGADIYKSLKPLWKSLISGDHAQTNLLRHLRQQLRDDIIHVVDELGPKVFKDFDKNRVIQAGRTSPTSNETLQRDNWIAWDVVDDNETDDIFFFSKPHRH